jgi:RNA polymerase sigma factor (sigma-70 family)
MKSAETGLGKGNVENFRRLLTTPEYEKLRRRLIRLFARRGCTAPDDLADETFSRVMAKIPEIAEEYEGDPIRFFYGVARNVCFEHLRRPVVFPLEGTNEFAKPSENRNVETLHECLEACMGELDPGERELIIEYYLHDKSAKIGYRKELARRRGMAMNALRLRAFRIRQRLHDRMVNCLASRTPD